MTTTITPNHQRAVDLLGTLPTDQQTIWLDVLDEMAEHDPYPTDDDYWADFLWYLRFLAAGGGDTGMAAADAGRTADEATDAGA